MTGLTCSKRIECLKVRCSLQVKDHDIYGWLEHTYPGYVQEAYEKATEHILRDTQERLKVKFSHLVGLWGLEDFYANAYDGTVDWTCPQDNAESAVDSLQDYYLTYLKEESAAWGRGE